MNSLKHDFREPKVYSTTGFKDTLASPLFYSVAVVALVLGIASIFGFLQNPMKLKAVANAVHDKVSVGSPVSSSPRKNLYSLTQSYTGEDIAEKKTLKIIDFTDVENNKHDPQSDFHHVTFNYDVTANDFWSDLDTTRLESAIEESERQDFEASLIGAPLKSEYHQQPELEIMQLNDSIYSLNTTPTRI